MIEKDHSALSMGGLVWVFMNNHGHPALRLAGTS